MKYPWKYHESLNGGVRDASPEFCTNLFCLDLEMNQTVIETDENWVDQWIRGNVLIFEPMHFCFIICSGKDDFGNPTFISVITSSCCIVPSWRSDTQNKWKRSWNWGRQMGDITQLNPSPPGH